MTDTFDIHEAKRYLSRLVARVEGGEELILARAGKPVARLVPYRRQRAPRDLGIWKGKIWIAPNFDDPLPEFDERLER
jgi:prevent-host-death family protein